jgi:hypothetical protein
MTIEAIARRFALPLIILALLPSSSTGQATSKPKPVTHTLTIEGMQFGPATLAVKTGDSIVWVNKDMFPQGRRLRLAADRAWQVVDLPSGQEGDIRLRVFAASHDAGPAAGQVTLRSATRDQRRRTPIALTPR